MRNIDPDNVPHSEAHYYLLGGVAPRPIAFVGTLDAKGRPNLSPFSFFNAFGANPPVIAFSPAYRGTDGTPKHTFLNIRETGEFTVSTVSYSMVEQVSLASGEYAHGVDEFEKSGFTKLASTKIAPFGVAESPMVMECRLLQHVDLGGGPASGNLMIGEVVMFHIAESAFNGKYLDADRMDLVARMGGPYYCRASGSAVFTLNKPRHAGIGFDGLPSDLRASQVLTGADLARLAGAERLPDIEPIRNFWNARMAAPLPVPDNLEIEERIGDADRLIELGLQALRDGEPPERFTYWIHRAVQDALNKGDHELAWRCAMAPTIVSDRVADL